MSVNKPVLEPVLTVGEKIGKTQNNILLSRGNWHVSRWYIYGTASLVLIELISISRKSVCQWNDIVEIMYPDGFLSDKIT